MLQIRDKCLVPLNYLQRLYVLIGIDVPATQFFTKWSKLIVWLSSVFSICAH